MFLFTAPTLLYAVVRVVKAIPDVFKHSNGISGPTEQRRNQQLVDRTGSRRFYSVFPVERSSFRSQFFLCPAKRSLSFIYQRWYESIQVYLSWTSRTQYYL